MGFIILISIIVIILAGVAIAAGAGDERPPEPAKEPEEEIAKEPAWISEALAVAANAWESEYNQ